MCHFIFLILPNKADFASIGALCDQHDRAFKPVQSDKIKAPILGDGELTFLTTVGHCDCGTALISRVGDFERKHNQDSELSKRAEKLRKDGWTQHKIDNWIAQKTAVREKNLQGREKEDKNDVDRWHDLISEVRSKGLSPYVGLIVLWDDKDTQISKRIPMKIAPNFAPLGDNAVYIFT